MYKAKIVEALKMTRKKFEKAQKAGRSHLSHDIDRLIVERHGADIFKTSPQIFKAQMATAVYSMKRCIHILKQSTEVYVPNLPDLIEDVKRMIPRADGSDELYDIPFVSVDVDALSRALMFKERRLPFEETALTFKNINGNIHCILAYPYKKYRHLLPDVPVEESMIIEYLCLGGSPWILPRFVYFEYDKVGAGYSDFVNEIRVMELAGLGDVLQKELDDHMKYALGSLMSLCEILECKNIYIKKNAGSAADRITSGVASSDFYTLAVKLGDKEVGVYDCSDSPKEQRYHLCRGNFATYTEEKPLFGKYVGRYWRPQHARGNKELGEIEKDYCVNLIQDK